MLPPKNDLTVCFAHVAYQLGGQFEKRNRGLRYFQARSREELEARVGESDVLVISGLWNNGILDRAPKLRFIQSIGAGTDQFPRELLTERGIRLASARGVNSRAVSDHGMALLLALARKLPEARDNQEKHIWRGMISDLNRREDELAGKKLFVVGLGAIGDRLARLAKAFEMEVSGFRRDVTQGKGSADSVHPIGELMARLPQADFVALTCPLTEATRHIINAEAFAQMQRSACLINVARGPCVDETALVNALSEGRIAAAAIDVTAEEPLSPTSPLWKSPNLFITPHTAGETRKYEDNVLDILEDNLDRLWRGEKVLRNQIL